MEEEEEEGKKYQTQTYTNETKIVNTTTVILQTANIEKNKKKKTFIPIRNATIYKCFDSFLYFLFFHLNFNSIRYELRIYA